MYKKKQHIFLWVARLPLLLLYVSFFAVQLFYNFDIASRPASGNIALIQKDNKDATQASVKKAPAPADKKTNFRLNKRYQPQPAITCNPVIIERVVCVVSSKLHVHYSSGFVPSSLPLAHGLRGPPVV